MFWYLLFAHLLADYPLQSDWMVKQKGRFRILLLHVAIHLGTLLVVVGAASRFLWPYLVALALIHFLVDLAKNFVNAYRPDWVIGPYIVDQIVHYISIWFVANWIGNQAGSLSLPFTRNVFIFSSAYLFVTYVWFISERILAYSNLPYRKEVVEQVWIRMVTRAAFLSGLLLAWRWLQPVSLNTTAVFNIPYLRGKNGIRALLTDISVAMAGLAMILWAI